MYAAHFGLAREPFSLAPDPRFLFMSERHREALAHLLYGVRGGGGFVLLTGEIGAGKTTIVRGFLEQLPAGCQVAYVFNPQLSALELLQTLATEFGLEPLPAEQRGSVKAHLDALNRFLLEVHAQGRQALVVIDEAQALEPALLEQLRLLTNLETAERKLLQIVLVGQPELRDRIAALEQLAQRVVARYHLGALTEAETAHYVAHRLGVAGLAGPLPLDPAAMRAIHRLAAGVPRRINLLADRALLGAYSRGLRLVGRKLVEQAAREVFDPRQAPASGRWPGLAVAGLAALLLGGAAVLASAWLRGPADRAGAETIVATSASTKPAAQGSGGAASSAARETSASVVAAAPAAAASMAAATGPMAEPAAPAADAKAVLALALADEAQGLRELALHWDVAIGEGEPCRVMRRADLACLRSPAGGLGLVRSLDRPALLLLQGDDGRPRQVLLVALDAGVATLQADRQRLHVALPVLAGLWRGEFVTVWRTPPGWAPGAAGQGAARAWAAAQLSAVLPAPRPPGLGAQVGAFQLLNALPVDGQVGPLTLMALSRAAGIDEPRLGSAGLARGR